MIIKTKRGKILLYLIAVLLSALLTYWLMGQELPRDSLMLKSFFVKVIFWLLIGVSLLLVVKLLQGRQYLKLDDEGIFYSGFNSDVISWSDIDLVRESAFRGGSMLVIHTHRDADIAKNMPYMERRKHEFNHKLGYDGLFLPPTFASEDQKLALEFALEKLKSQLVADEDHEIDVKFNNKI